MLYAAANPAIHPYGTPNPYADAGGPAPSIEAETQWFHQANDRLLEVSERALARNPEDVTALYFRGLAFENQAAEAIVIGRDKRGAIGPGMEAKRTHERVLELDPTFTDARMSLAAYEYALATVDGFAGLVLALPRLFGFFRGDLDGALATMETAARLGRYRALDARVILSMMHAFEGDPERSVAILESLGRQYPENYLLDLSRAAIQEWRMNDPEAALETYRALLVALPAKHPGLGEAEVRLRIGRTLVGLERYAEARTAFLSALEAAASESETHPLCRESLALLPKRSPVVPGVTDSP
jgi:tetratricopeptide (TPR) repeat protein